MRYAAARYQRELQDRAYRIYVTDALRMISKNAAATLCFASRGEAAGEYFEGRFAEIIRGEKPEPTLKPGDAKRRILAKFRGGES